MSSKQRVKAVFAGQIPDQVPRWCGASSEFWSAAKQSVAQLDGHPQPYSDEQLRVRLGDDFRRVFTRYSGPQQPLQPGGYA